MNCWARTEGNKTARPATLVALEMTAMINW